MSLRPKSVQVKVQITGAFARTRVLSVFQNELSRRSEADFEYVVPDGALVTGFAYWFNKEKVVARVVEKERAADIYRTITTYRRDPALIEQVDRNRFRARIFPIEANADLKIEMQWVQVLPSDVHGLLYTFPLKSEKEGKGTLDSLDINVRIQHDNSIGKIINNYKLPVEETKSDLVLRLSQKQYRAPEDLVVRLLRPARALHASLYAAPSGGRDGFFALALTPSQNLASPKLSISGVQTFGVLPSRLPSLKAHQTYWISGRYRGSGKATLLLTGFGHNVARATLVFGARREDNNLATKLWAASLIESLSQTSKSINKNRERIAQLSMRYTLPSRVTSWLAVPKSEWEAFKEIIAWNDIERYGRPLAKLMRNGKGQSRAARQLRARFNAACKIVGRDPRIQLKSFIAQSRGENYYKLNAQRSRIAGKLAQATARGEWRAVKALRRKVINISELMGEETDAANTSIRSAQEELLNGVAREWAKEKVLPRPSNQKLRDLQTRMDRLARASGVNLAESQRYAARDQLSVLAWNAARNIADEIAAGKAQSEKTRQLRTAYDQQANRLDNIADDILDKSIASAIRSKAGEAARAMVNQQWQMKPDGESIAKNEATLRNLLPSEVNREQVIQEAERQWGWRVDNFAASYVQEQRAEKPDQEKLDYYYKVLERALAVRQRESTSGNAKALSPEELKKKADEKIVETEINNVLWPLHEIRQRLGVEQELSNPNKERIEKLQKQMEEILAPLSKAARRQLEEFPQHIKPYVPDKPAKLQVVRDVLEAELREKTPEPMRVQQLEKELVRLSPFDWYYQSSGWNSGRLIRDPQEYGKARIERIQTRVDREKLEEQLHNNTQALPAAEKAALTARRVQLVAREKQLTARMGDPLIAVQAPQDAQQVIAVLPGGELRHLTWNAEASRWEARFDIPTYASEGEYAIAVIVVLADGTRQQLTMTYRVDTTAPGGNARAAVVRNESTRVLRLEFAGDEDTARVQAITAEGRKIDLAPSSEKPDSFFAIADLAGADSEEGSHVYFIVTDRAHNRTTIEVDLSDATP